MRVRSIRALLYFVRAIDKVYLQQHPHPHYHPPYW